MDTPITRAREFLNQAILPNAVLDTIVMRTTHGRKITEYVIVTTGDTRGIVTTENDHNNHRESVNLSTPSPAQIFEIKSMIASYNEIKQKEFNERAALLQSLETNTWNGKSPDTHRPAKRENPES